MAESLVLRAILQGLQADIDLMALVKGVYETPPRDTEKPYISINRVRIADASTKTSDHFDVSIDLTVWDETASSKTVRTILERLREVIPTLQPAVGSFTDLHVSDTDLMRDHDQSWVRARVSLRGLFTGG